MPADRVFAKLGADRRSLHDLEIHRQLARAKRNGELRRAVDGEVAADARRPAEDGLIDVGRGQYAAVEDHGERLVDVRLRGARELVGARAIEGDADDRRIVLWIKLLLGVDQVRRPRP